MPTQFEPLSNEQIAEIFMLFTRPDIFDTIVDFLPPDAVSELPQVCKKFYELLKTRPLRFNTSRLLAYSDNQLIFLKKEILQLNELLKQKLREERRANNQLFCDCSNTWESDAWRLRDDIAGRFVFLSYYAVLHSLLFLAAIGCIELGSSWVESTGYAMAALVVIWCFLNSFLVISGNVITCYNKNCIDSSNSDFVSYLFRTLSVPFLGPAVFLVPSCLPKVEIEDCDLSECCLEIKECCFDVINFDEKSDEKSRVLIIRLIQQMIPYLKELQERKTSVTFPQGIFDVLTQYQTLLISYNKQSNNLSQNQIHTQRETTPLLSKKNKERVIETMGTGKGLKFFCQKHTASMNTLNREINGYANFFKQRMQTELAKNDPVILSHVKYV